MATTFRCNQLPAAAGNIFINNNNNYIFNNIPLESRTIAAQVLISRWSNARFAYVNIVVIKTLPGR